MSKASLKYTIVFAAVSALTGCTKPVETAQEAPVVLVRPAEAGTIAALRTNGIVESLDHHVLASETSGRLLQLTAVVGDRVTKGEMLARIDVQPTQWQLTQAQADLKSAEADFALRQSNLARMKGLTEAGTVSAADLERAQTEYQAAQQTVLAARARAGLAQRATSETLIQAPADGVVTARHVQPSQIVAAGTPLFEIEGGSSRVIRTLVPPSAVSQVKAGLVLTYEFDGKLSQARLTGLSSQASATGAVEATLATGPDAPMPGTPVTVLFNPEATSAVSVPATAIVLTDKGERHVLTVNDKGRVEAIPVTLVQLTRTGALISGAISPGTKVVAAGTDWVKAGQKVTPRLMPR